MWRAIAALLIATTAARAAAIDVVPLGPNDPSLVKVTGRLESSDKDLFLLSSQNTSTLKCGCGLR
jgi:hypothetical protein